MGMEMSKSIALLIVFVFVIAPCLVMFNPVSADASWNTWVSKAPMHAARSGLGVAVVNGKIYAIGGVAFDSKVESKAVSINEEYNPETDTWTMRAPMPTPRAHFAITAYKNKIYCIGGVGGVNEVYDPATDTWENRTAMPTPQSFMDANVVNGKIYVIGGDSNKNINQVYDPATDSWTTKAPVPAEVWGYASVAFENKIYIFRSYLTAIYDVESDKWSKGASPGYPSAVGGVKAGAMTGVNASKEIFVLGASVFDTADRTQFNLVYDPDYDRWMSMANFTTFRSEFAVAVVNDKLYAIGGFTMKGVGIDEYLRTYDWYEQTWYATNEEYTPFGYGTPDPSYVPPDTAPPEIAVASPQNRTYYATDVALNFTVNEPASSMRYVFDGENLGVSGNMTLAGLAYGVHNVTVYAVDMAGNIGTSETISFTIAEEPELFPVVPVAAASVASVALIGVGLLVYFKKRKR
jgi:N-acetylneuraminic acid mutarotase